MRLHTDLIASSHWTVADEDFRSIRSDVMKVYFATFFYCILTAQLWRAADFVSVAEIIASKVADAAKDLLQGKKEIVKTTADDIAGKMCGNIIEDNPEYCNNTAPGNWFIVVDASWSNDNSLYEKTKVYYEEQKKIVDQIIEYISKVNGGIAISDDKHEISIILATDSKIDVIRNLCNSETEGRKLPPKVGPTTDGIPLGEILEEIDQQSTHCNWRPNRQRFVLYIAQNAMEGSVGQALKILKRWEEDPNRSTRVAFIIISEAVKSGFEPVKDVTQPGALFLNPKLDKFKQSRRILGKFAAQCSCSVSEDCSTENGKTIKNCHFNMDGREERCTMTVELRLEQPLQRFHVPSRVRALPSCWPNATRVSECSHAKCMDDCNLKGWTAWSNCESHWNQGFLQKRFRLNETAGPSQFGTSCKKDESRKCDPPVQNITPKAVPKIDCADPFSYQNGPTYTLQFGAATTMAASTNVSTAIWGLFFALIVLSGSIVVAAFIVIRVKRHRRRRRGHSPAGKNVKGRRRDVRTNSFLSRSRMSLKPTSVKVDKKHGQKTAASLRVKKLGRTFGGGVDAVGGSSLSINEVEAPSTKISSKIGEVSKAQSSFRKQNPNFSRSFGPMGASLKVSLLENDRRSTKNDSVFGKMGSSKTSQSRTSQSKTSQSKTSKKVG